MKRIREILSFPGSDKVALFLLFIATAIAARGLVASRSKIELDSPVKLVGSGLSVAMPKGEIWKKDNNGKWKYSNSSYKLMSTRFNQRMKTATVAAVIYHLANDFDNAQNYISEVLPTEENLEEGQFSFDGIDVSWAAFQSKERFDSLRRQPQVYMVYRVVGFAKLGPSRQLEIRVESFEGMETAMRVFKALQKGMSFEKVAEIEQGLDFVKNTINSGYFARARQEQKLLMVKDKSDSPIGFRMERKRYADLNERQSVIVRSFEYIADKRNAVNTTELNYVPDFSEFTIRSREESSGRGQSAFIESKYEYPNLNISSSKAIDMTRLKFSHNVISEQLYNELIEAFVKSNYDKIIVDLIDDKSRVVPTFLESKVDDLASKVVVLKSLDGSQAVIEAYLDSYGSIEKMVSRDLGYSLVATSKDEVEKTFPMWYQMINQP